MASWRTFMRHVTLVEGLKLKQNLVENLNRLVELETGGTDGTIPRAYKSADGLPCGMYLVLMISRTISGAC